MSIYVYTILILHSHKVIAVQITSRSFLQSDKIHVSLKNHKSPTIMQFNQTEIKNTLFSLRQSHTIMATSSYFQDQPFSSLRNSPHPVNFQEEKHSPQDNSWSTEVFSNQTKQTSFQQHQSKKICFIMAASLSRRAERYEQGQVPKDTSELQLLGKTPDSLTNRRIPKEIH